MSNDLFTKLVNLTGVSVEVKNFIQVCLIMSEKQFVFELLKQELQVNTCKVKKETLQLSLVFKNMTTRTIRCAQ